MIPLLRALALLGLLLLPIQMRAGAASPHPHALLHLLLEARDGAFDHHLGKEATAAATDHNVEHVEATGSPPPDIPAYATSITATGGLAVLAVVVTVLTLPAPRAGRTWPRHAWWRERRPALEPPPPRLSCL
jgi:hypothetical protein